MNAVFNLKMEVTVGENLLTGVSVRTLIKREKRLTHMLIINTRLMLNSLINCLIT